MSNLKSIAITVGCVVVGVLIGLYIWEKKAEAKAKAAKETPAKG